MGRKVNNLTNPYSVYLCNGSELKMKKQGKKSIIQECLRPFPYIWASVDSFFL